MQLSNKSFLLKFDRWVCEKIILIASDWNIKFCNAMPNEICVFGRQNAKDELF